MSTALMEPTAQWSAHPRTCARFCGNGACNARPHRGIAVDETAGIPKPGTLRRCCGIVMQATADCFNCD